MGKKTNKHTKGPEKMPLLMGKKQHGCEQLDGGKKTKKKKDDDGGGGGNELSQMGVQRTDRNIVSVFTQDICQVLKLHGKKDY